MELYNMKTTVEWLEHMLLIVLNKEEFKKIEFSIKQAKEMEKQQIIDARVTSPLLDTCNKNDYVIEAEQYYNETFNK
jgi:hypothetical protein